MAGDWGALPEESERPTPPTEPPDLSPDVATSLVRSVALRHGAQRVLERVGNIPKHELAAACNAYADGFRTGETPLVLIDRSMLGTFKGGLLLTNRALYSNLVPHPIRLASIYEVGWKVHNPHPGCLADFVFGPFAHLYKWVKHGRLKAGLAVNGDFVCTERVNVPFWTEALLVLGHAAREAARRTSDDGSPPRGWGWPEEPK